MLFLTLRIPRWLDSALGGDFTPHFFCVVFSVQRVGRAAWSWRGAWSHLAGLVSGFCFVHAESGKRTYGRE